MVIQSNKAHQVTDYISKNLANIYHNKKVQHSSVVTHQQEYKTRSYKLALVENITSKVGTYAEILTRRFTPNNSHGDESEKLPEEKNTHYGDNFTGQQTPTKGNCVTPVKAAAGSTSQASRGNCNQSNIERTKVKKATVPNGAQNNTPMDITPEDITNETDGDIEISQSEIEYESNEEDTTGKQLAWVEKLMELEHKVTSQQTEMNKRNSEWLTSLEDKLEAKIERIMESKMLEMSMAVADIVTHRLSKAMGKIVKGSGKLSTPTVTILNEQVTTQECLVSIEQNSTSLGENQTPQNTNPLDYLNSTQKMVQELNNIEQHATISDPPHDVTTTGSVTVSS